MNINGTAIQQTDVKGTVYYNLADICMALNLDLIESLNYLEAQKQTRPLIAGGDAWINEKALMHWMVMPQAGRPLSPESLTFAQECAKKTLQAWELAGF